MSDQDPGLTRRDVLVLGGALAAQAGWIGAPHGAQAAAAAERVPTRPFGRTGRPVSILGLGGHFDVAGNQALLERALARGVTYWEVTLSKGGAGYGSYFRDHPADRDAVFLLAKTSSTATDVMDRQLAQTLTDAATRSIDFFLVQGLSDPALLSPELRAWVERQRAAGRIRAFGFSTHANMAACLSRAATLDWIDGIVTAYNYRLMEQPELRAAVDACADAGIALTAIKTQALPTNPAAQIGTETPSARASIERLTGLGSDPAEAKLRAVWSNPRIASALSLMPDARLLDANCDAACARAPLSELEWQSLREHARATATHYCTGCAHRCEARVAGALPISRVLRYAMYAHAYGDLERARTAFTALPAATRKAIASADYSRAEGSCPQRIEIGAAMRRAAALLA